MASSTINPFIINSSASRAASSRRRVAASSDRVSPDEINAAELKKALQAKNQNREVSIPLQEKLELYFSNGNSHGHLADRATAAEFNVYVNKALRGEDTTVLSHLVSEDHSLLRDQLSRAGYDTESLPQLLLDYAERALVAKAQGRDLKKEPLPLLDGDNPNAQLFIEMLTSRESGLTTEAARLVEIRNSSDPILRLSHQIANHLGLGDAIRATRTFLRKAEANPLTERLESIPDLLKTEYNQLNTILEPDGSLIVERLAGGRVSFIPAIELNATHLSLLGTDARYFTEMKSLDFGDFFRRAHALAVAGNDNELSLHVAQGASLIMAYYNLELNTPGLREDRRTQLTSEFKLLAQNIQGKGLIPTTLARIIREKVTEATLSSDFVNRANAGIEDRYSSRVIREFLDGVRSPEITSHASLRTLISSSKVIEIPSVSGNTTHLLKWLEDGQTSTSQESQDNRDLVDKKPISLERAVKAYADIVDARIIQINNALEPVLSPGDSSTGTIAQTRQGIVEGMQALKAFPDIESIAQYTSDTLSNISTQNINAEQDQLEKALTSFAGRILGSQVTNDNRYQSLRGFITDIAINIINKTETSTEIDALLNELMRLKASKANAFRAQFNGQQGKEALQQLFNACIKETGTSQGFLDKVNLDNIEAIFKGTEGLELAKQLELMSTSGAKARDIIDSRGEACYGSFAGLLFAQDRDGHTEPEKRLMALLRLVTATAATSDAHFQRLTKHVIEQLETTSSNANTINLITQFQRASKTLDDAANASNFNALLVAQDRLVFLEENLQARQRELDHIREQSSSIVIRNFGDEAKYAEYRAALQSILGAVERLSDRDSGECVKDLTEQLRNDGNDKAQAIALHLIHQLDLTGLSASYSGEHEANLIDRLVIHIERILNSRYLATFARAREIRDNT